MKKEEHEVMFNVEDTYWWYVGLRDLVLSHIEEFKKKTEDLRILDAGCGTGKMLEVCRNHEVFGIDFSNEALTYCKLRNLNNLFRGSIGELPFKSNCFHVVISLDVLGQSFKHEDDVETLKEINRVISRNGVLLLHLPAYKFLRSRHDEAVGINLRYTVKEVKGKIQEAGFEVEKITYRNTILFPIIFMKRIMEKLFVNDTDYVASDLKPLPHAVNKFLSYILFFENALIKSGMKFPFGLSVYCIARKKKYTI